MRRAALCSPKSAVLDLDRLGKPLSESRFSGMIMDGDRQPVINDSAW
jgi:hypothetical protein